MDVHKAGERENQSDRYEKEEKVIKGVIIMNKKKQRNLRSKDRRAPTRVVDVAGSARWLRRWQTRRS